MSTYSPGCYKSALFKVNIDFCMHSALLYNSANLYTKRGHEDLYLYIKNYNQNLQRIQSTRDVSVITKQKYNILILVHIFQKLHYKYVSLNGKSETALSGLNDVAHSCIVVYRFIKLLKVSDENSCVG